jgi:antitoxin MazE
MMYTAIKKWGNSQGIRLSKDVLKAADLHEGERVEIEAAQGALKIKKLKRYDSLEALFDGYREECKPGEFDYGEDVGLEVIE